MAVEKQALCRMENIQIYAKLGYEAVGGFLPPGERYELMFCKKL